ncbi:Fungal specific transcription factor domain [Rhizoctonia solani]|uniref:Fungal specific transcription factor domain n=1 Tax=Rhizoctonia solani TaxID=456999 RepID=A0A8H8SWA1_9AGAM|nr:Fungal specific transcription factor domain [Rhizoctonia solani]QRW20801.1 Fungal specific transcription factor domain [Rhizoctonia solani]
MGLECSGYQYFESVSSSRKQRKPRTKPAVLHTFAREEVGTSAVPPHTSEISISNELGNTEPLDSSSNLPVWDFLGGVQLPSVNLVSGPYSANCTLLTSGSYSESPLEHIPALAGGKQHQLLNPSIGIEVPVPGNRAVIPEAAQPHSLSLRPDYFLEGRNVPSLAAHMDSASSETSQAAALVTQRSGEHFADCARGLSNSVNWGINAALSNPKSGESFSSVGWEEEEEGEELEGLKQMIGTILALDNTVADNVVPFVLQHAAQWIMIGTFEPLKILWHAKERVLREVSASDSTRAHRLVVGRAMRSLLKSPMPDETCTWVISLLFTAIDQKAARYALHQVASNSGVDPKQAMLILEDYTEVLSMLVCGYPFRSWYPRLCKIAPVFGHACPDPLGQPVYLPGILNSPAFSCLCFISMDISTSVIYGLPMLCKYDAGFSLKLCDEIYQRQQNYGFQWLHGIPDQFILLLTWVNNLYEYRGTAIEPSLLRRIEDDLSKIRIPPVESVDPALRIERKAVQEGWRQAAYIYLYMKLHGVNAQDSRVKQASRIFMRLANETKPGHSLDAFLVVPMMIVGVVLLKQRDRNAICDRIRGHRECQNPESALNGNIRMMEDVWSRIAIEGRAAIWPDLRIACYNVTGM